MPGKGRAVSEQQWEAGLEELLYVRIWIRLNEMTSLTLMGGDS